MMRLSTTGKLIAAMAVCMMMVLPAGIALSSSESSDAAGSDTYTYNLSGGEDISTSQRLTMAGNGGINNRMTSSSNIPTFIEVSIDGSGYVSLTGTAPREGGNYVFTASFSYRGSSSYLAVDVTFVLNITSAKNTVIYSYNGSDVSITYDWGNVTLYNPGTSESYVVRWYTSSSGGTLIGDGGQTVSTIVDNITLYGRLEQSKVIIPSTSDHVYVHYRDYVEYIVNAIPPTSYIVSAKWVSASVTLPIVINGLTVRVDSVELASGNYEMAITVAATGLESASMVLNVHVYPHVITDIDPYRLGAWSYIVSTYNNLDRMELISATRSIDGVTSDISASSISLDSMSRTIAYTFTAEGYYEFSLRLVSETGERNTTILRIYVVDEPLVEQPSADGILVVPGHDLVSFSFMLQNPANYSTITWSYGDGTVETNTSTSRNHSYVGSGVYTVTAMLSNTEGDTMTVTVTVEVTIVEEPDEAFLGEMYIALVEVTTSSTTDIEVTCPDWMSWELMVTANGNFVRVFGVFTDTLIVGDRITIEVYESGSVTSWYVDLRPAKTEALIPSFDYEVDGMTLRIRYTGTQDASTDIQVQWDAGTSGYAVYRPTADGWMYHTYVIAKSYVVSVSAIRDGIERTASEVIVIGDFTTGNGIDDDDDPEDGTAWLVLFGAALLIAAAGAIAAYKEKKIGYFMIAFAAILAIVAFILFKGWW